MLLQDLLDSEGLALRVVHAPPGAADRPVTGVCTTDLLDPGRYLAGGELVITGLMWRREPTDSDAFVRNLTVRGVAALAAGDALLGSIPDDLVVACRRHKLPLLGVPTEVAFAEVAEQVAHAVVAARGARLSATLGRQRQLLSAVAAGQSLTEIAARVSAEIGHVCRVVTATGRQVAAGPAPLTCAESDAVTEAFFRATRLPTVVALPDRALSIFPVGSALENRLAAWVLVVDSDWTRWDTHAVDTVGELATVAALDRVRSDEGLRAVRHITDEALTLADSGGTQTEVGLRLRQAGLDPAESVVVVVAEFACRPELLETARTVLEDVASSFGPPVVSVVEDRYAVAVLPAADAGLVPDLRRALSRLAPGVAGVPLTIGVSSPAAPAALSGALEEARHARRVAELRPGKVSIVTGDDITSYVLLLATVPDEVRRTFATRVLGPVLDYDARTDAGLMTTLEAFLACSGSWSRAAEQLHLHVNTVRYRIGRVESLTGRDLGLWENRVDMFLATRSL